MLQDTRHAVRRRPVLASSSATATILVGAAAFDPISGIAVIPLPSRAARSTPAGAQVLFASSDFQEAKNVNTIGQNVLPNTTIKMTTLPVVNGAGDHLDAARPAAPA